jgi:hypothetical protein
MLQVLGRVTMQVFVCDHCTMVAAPVQCDVDGIPKGWHDVGSTRRLRIPAIVLTIIFTVVLQLLWGRSPFPRHGSTSRSTCRIDPSSSIPFATMRRPLGRRRYRAYGHSHLSDLLIFLFPPLRGFQDRDR